VSDSTIVVEDLHVRYHGGDRDAVDGISFEVRPGEILGLLGPNGAGKSTTQKVLTKLLRGHRGQAAVLGRDVREWDAGYYERIGVGFELPAHFSKLTARENLEAFASLYEGRVEDPQALLERVGLAGAADQRVGGFSKGMQMRLNLARALLNRPEVLFLDEPTSGLDPVGARQVRELIHAQAEAGRTVFLTTHDMGTVDALCDRVAFVLDGRIAALDTTRNLKLAHGTRVVTVEYHTSGHLRRQEFPVQGLGEDTAFLALLREGAVETIHTREASLDDVFIKVTGGRL